MSQLWRILTKEEAINADVRSIKNKSIKKCLKELKEYGEIVFDKSCLSSRDIETLDKLVIETLNDRVINRGPIYYGVLRIPSASGTELDLDANFINKIWKAEMLYSLNIIKEFKNDIARIVAAEHLLESMAFLVLVLNRLIVDYKKSPENAFVKSVYGISYAGETLSSIIDGQEPRSKIISRLEYLIDEVFRFGRSIGEYFIYNSRKGNTIVKRKQFNNVLILDKFWRPREGMNEIRNYRFAQRSRETVEKGRYSIDIVAGILYGGATIIGHVIGALREIEENALPAVIVFSRNESVFNRSHRVSSILLDRYKHITKLWGSMYGRSVYIVDDSIGTALTMAYAALIAMHFTKGKDIDSYIENVKLDIIKNSISMEVLQKIVLYKIISSYRDINVGAVALDKKYLDEHLVNILKKMIAPPDSPRISFRKIIDRAKTLYKEFGVRLYNADKIELSFFIEDPDIYRRNISSLRSKLLYFI